MCRRVRVCVWNACSTNKMRDRVICHSVRDARKLVSDANAVEIDRDSIALPKTKTLRRSESSHKNVRLVDVDAVVRRLCTHLQR